MSSTNDMKNENFYKLIVTKNNKEKAHYFGYMPYEDIMVEVNDFYDTHKADAVEMIMMKKEEFNKEVSKKP